MIENNTLNTGSKRSRRRKTKKLMRAVSKIGMGISLVAVTATGFISGSQSMRIHTGAGVAMLALTLTHMSLYKKKTRKKQLLVA